MEVEGSEPPTPDSSTDTLEPAAIEQLSGSGSKETTESESSSHRGGANFCFGDGSVRSVRMDASQTSQTLGLDAEDVDTVFAYETNFTGGVNVAAGDVNGDGTDDLITAADTSGGPHVRVFSGVGDL